MCPVELSLGSSSVSEAMSEISEIFQNVCLPNCTATELPVPLSLPLSLSLNLTSLKAGKQISIVDVINAKFTLFVCQSPMLIVDYVMSRKWKICQMSAKYAQVLGYYLFYLMNAYEYPVLSAECRASNAEESWLMYYKGKRLWEAQKQLF